MKTGAAGFSLIEVLVATAIVMVGVASLAQLAVVSARANGIANATTMTLLLAQQKMEQLRGDRTALSPSPPGALSAPTEGFVDYIDRIGASLGGASTTPPPGAVYIRQWAIEPLAGSPGNAILLQVLVVPRTGSGRPGGSAGSAGSGVARAPGGVRLISVKPRRAD